MPAQTCLEAQPSSAKLQPSNHNHHEKRDMRKQQDKMGSGDIAEGTKAID
jgi:hypothetical protein